MPETTIETSIGRLVVTERDGWITRVTWAVRRADFQRTPPDTSPTPVLEVAERQLAEYFAGARRAFDLPLDPRGDARQARILTAMQAIPYGETRTYGEIARDLEIRPDEVGQGCAANPIPVIIPCHRVLAATGLGGYSGAGGVETKIALLKLEGGFPLLL